MRKQKRNFDKIWNVILSTILLCNSLQNSPQINSKKLSAVNGKKHKPTFWSTPFTCCADVNFGWKLDSNTSWRFATATRDKAPLFGFVGAEERRVEPGYTKGDGGAARL